MGAPELQDIQLYLGSASPRRQELLAQMGLRYYVVAPQIDEHRQPGEAAPAMVARLARAKAVAVAAQLQRQDLPEHPVLAADTEVILDGEVLGKPHDAAHAGQILRRLSGRTHEVVTGLTLLHGGAQYEELSRSEVTFKPLSAAEIDAYWASGEPRDKAGAYAIQGRGAIFVRRLVGSYSGVMGLPLYELQQLLLRIGLSCL